VGGGPGGSTVAWRLARAGLRVLVLDAATFPRVKLCAGWVTRRALADLELAPDAYPRTIQPFASVTIAVDGREHETRWDEPVSYGIVRAEFDTFLLRRAAGAGAEVREDVRVRAVHEAGAAVMVEAGAERFTAPLVVGAGGGLAIRERLARLLARLRGDGRLPPDLALTPFRGHAYRVRRGLPRRLAGERFVLVGDAAGLARDVSGEGIGPAVRSGLLAAETILDGRPASYAERVAGTFGRPEHGLARLTRHLPESIIVAFARLACTRPGLRRRLVLEGAFGMG